MSGFLDRINEAAINALDKSKEIADITKLRLEIRSEEKLIKAYKMVIGEYVASHGLLSEDSIVSEQVGKILAEQEKIKANLEKIELLKKV